MQNYFAQNSYNNNKFEITFTLIKKVLNLQILCTHMFLGQDIPTTALFNTDIAAEGNIFNDFNFDALLAEI